MKIDPSTGLISPCNFTLSPNHDAREDGHEISLLVIHGISLPPGEFGNGDVQDFFLNKLAVDKHPYFQEIADVKVSSHLFIDRLGEMWQFVPFSKRAWHAGESNFQGQDKCNNFSIGIELEGTDELPYAREQYKKLAEVTVAVLETYPRINWDRIVGHSDIAPSRKTDPGPTFDWPYYRQLVANLS